MKILAMLPSYFDYVFVHLKQKARLRPELSPKCLSTLSPNPARTEKSGPTNNSGAYSTRKFLYNIQSNAAYLTTYGNVTKRSLLRGGRVSEFCLNNFNVSEFKLRDSKPSSGHSVSCRHRRSQDF